MSEEVETLGEPPPPLNDRPEFSYSVIPLPQVSGSIPARCIFNRGTAEFQHVYEFGKSRELHAMLRLKLFS